MTPRLRSLLYPGGLFRRLRRQLTVLLVVALVVLECVVYFGFRALQSDDLDGTLRQAADRLRALPAALPHINAGLVGTVTPSDLFVAFVTADGTVLVATTPVSTDDTPSAPSISGPALTPGAITGVTAPGGTDYAALLTRLDVRVTVRGQQGVTRLVGAVVGYPLTAKQRALRNLLIAELLFAAVILAGWALLSRSFLHRGLRPLMDIARTAEAITAGRSHERLAVDPEDPELGRVTATLNEAFDARQASEDRMRDFVADASHELRTPLTSVQGWADLYREGGIPDREGVDAAMHHIWTDARRMRALVEQMLELVRAETGAQGGHAVRLEPVRVRPLLTDALAEARLLHPDHVYLLADVDEGLTVLAEPMSLHRAVQNLLVNAGRHTPAATTVTVSAIAGSGADPRVQLRVDDDGPGMTDSERAAAFDRFWRADHSRQRPGGSGLGLSICRSIFRSFDGDLRLERSPDGGLSAVAAVPAAE